MHDRFLELLRFWFHFVETQGYLGVFLLMALESSIVPLPSEIVMPPAAYWAAQGRMDFWLVVLAGAGGGLFGSLVSYGLARAVGVPVVMRYGKYVLLTPKKVEEAEDWVLEYGVAGIFFARLLPVVRHLISIPAGLLRMPVGRFSLATTAGAFLWCLILAWFGRQVIGDRPQLLDSPDQLMLALKAKTHVIGLGVAAFAAAYALMLWLKRRGVARHAGEAPRA